MAGQKAADARWGRDVQRATHYGEIQIGDDIFDCVVLEDGRRVINQGSIMKVLGRSESTGRRARDNNRPPFISANNLSPYITAQLADQLQRIDYRVGTLNQVRSGYNAEILPRVCNVYLDAREAGVLTSNQTTAAESAERVVKALALVGITALVDEATGYQDERAKKELQQLLDAYIAEDFRPWVKTFPDVFFKELYRIFGWEFKPGATHRPKYVGRFINDYVYEPMPDGVLEKLKELNPVNDSGNRSRRHHQYLTEDTGYQHLQSQIQQVMALMKASSDREEFKILFSKAFQNRQPEQTMLHF